MKYSNIKEARFISRPNRFIANIEMDGKIQVCHVKNTGRCKELLVPNATVFVQESDNRHRKTKYDLISVYKGNRLVNVDSQIPNKVFEEWVRAENIFHNISLIKAEATYKNSRFDFYIEADGKKVFVEVKGVTLEIDGVALFPDAPTERGVKHIKELCKCLDDGYEAYLVFIIQMKNVKYFAPNAETHKEFAETLKTAKKKGVNMIAVDCEVTKNSIVAKDYVEVKI